MRKATTLVVPALMLTFGVASAADLTMSDEMYHHGNAMLRQSSFQQDNMFDGISLTELQRQQLRDLTQQVRNDRSHISINDLAQLHELIIADKFDQNAFQDQAEKIAQAEVLRQVEIARVRNQMYHLLTPQQQAVLNQKYQQRMHELRSATTGGRR